jgi:hypothetical protein
VHLLVRRHFENKKQQHRTTRTQLGFRPSQSDPPMSPTGGAATWLFSVRFCALGGAGGSACTTYRRRRREICFFPFTACAPGD